MAALALTPSHPFAHAGETLAEWPPQPRRTQARRRDRSPAMLLTPSRLPGAMEAVLGLKEGQRLADRFRLEYRLMDGGMGALWVATDEWSDRDVIVKLLSAEMMENEEAVLRFQQEAQLIASLQSPHIVGFIAQGVIEGAPYIVLERLQGEDLEQRLLSGRLPLEDCARILHETACALLVAHARGVIHRDIKPGNIFLAEQHGTEVVKLLDFGVAKLREGARVRTGAGITVGSPDFMSPEQVEGKRDLDGRSDLFALASVIYTCVTGRMAFHGEDLTDTFQRTLRAKFEPPTRVVSHLPPELDAFFEKALALKREDRFPNAAAMARAFREIVDAAASRPPTWCGASAAPSLPPPRVDERRNLILCAAGVALMLGAAAATAIWVDATGASPAPSLLRLEVLGGPLVR